MTSAGQPTSTLELIRVLWSPVPSDAGTVSTPPRFAIFHLLLGLPVFFRTSSHRLARCRFHNLQFSKRCCRV